MNLYISKLPQVPFGEMVDEMLKRIGDSLSIKIEEYSFAVYESHKGYGEGIWTYEADNPPIVVLHRWIDSYQFIDGAVEFKDSGDSSQTNLERDLKAKIESMMKLSIEGQVKSPIKLKR